MEKKIGQGLRSSSKAGLAARQIVTDREAPPLALRTDRPPSLSTSLDVEHTLTSVDHTCLDSRSDVDGRNYSFAVTLHLDCNSLMGILASNT